MVDSFILSRYNLRAKNIETWKQWETGILTGKSQKHQDLLPNKLSILIRFPYSFHENLRSKNLRAKMDDEEGQRQNRKRHEVANGFEHRSMEECCKGC